MQGFNFQLQYIDADAWRVGWMGTGGGGRHWLTFCGPPLCKTPKNVNPGINFF